MTTSLREEITSIITDNYTRGIINQPAELTTRDILQLIEKRIDSIKEYNTPENWKNLNKHEQVKILHYLLALDDVKEMLK